jgi:hypothetical protein
MFLPLIRREHVYTREDATKGKEIYENIILFSARIMFCRDRTRPGAGDGKS